MYECYCGDGFYLHSNGYNCIGKSPVSCVLPTPHSAASSFQQLPAWGGRGVSAQHLHSDRGWYRTPGGGGQREALGGGAGRVGAASQARPLHRRDGRGDPPAGWHPTDLRGLREGRGRGVAQRLSHWGESTWAGVWGAGRPSGLAHGLGGQHLQRGCLLWAGVRAGGVQDPGEGREEMSLSPRADRGAVRGVPPVQRSSRPLRPLPLHPAHPPERLQRPPPGAGLQAPRPVRSVDDHRADGRHVGWLSRSHPHRRIRGAQVTVTAFSQKLYVT